MDDIELRLRQAMVVYVGGDRAEISSEMVLRGLKDRLGITADRVSVHKFWPEDFLVVFARQEDRNLVFRRPVLEFHGQRLSFGQWIRQSQAVFAAMRFKVRLVIEGLPPHAWELEVVEALLGGSCIIDSVAPETSARTDLAAFRLSAWTADPELIPIRRWLAVPEPEEQQDLFQPKTLQYKVLIHLDAVTSFSEGEEPWFLRGSSDSGQSGLPDSDIDLGGETNTQSFGWQFGVRDQRGDNAGNQGGRRSSAGGAAHHLASAVVAPA